jgi:hypothetical protein
VPMNLTRSSVKRMQDATWLGDDQVKFVFDNLRNVVLSLSPLVAAKVYLKNPYGEPIIWVKVAASIFAFASMSLLALNVFHVWRRFSLLRVTPWVSVPCAMLYAFFISLLWLLLKDART